MTLNNRQLTVAILFAIPAFFCELAAMMSPVWLGTFGETSLGLFEACIDGVCFYTLRLNDFFGVINKVVTGLIVSSCLILVLSIALILMGCWRNDFRLTRLSSVVMLFSGIITLTGVVTYLIGVTIAQKDGESSIYATREWSFNYRFYVSWIGALLTITAGVLGLTSYEVCTCCPKRTFIYGDYKVKITSSKNKENSLPSFASLIERQLSNEE
ncbi:uncharacterized protein LOC143465229 [Clavelina lepadiformis]|uniref:Uncharacterized protein n=1 Tax=Clavelina lepadiformis TaxID=159417 RepID=A0ABP0EWP0_CLALP